MSEKQLEGRAALTRMLLPDNDTHAGGEIGALLWTLLDGLLVQWLLDPTTAPSAEKVVGGLRAIAPLL